MELTKQLEAEIKQVMDDYWNSYFNGDIGHWATYLAEGYRNIGGTEEEVWNSKKEIVDYTNRVIDQMVGTSEIRNKEVQIIPYDPYFMVHELLDIYLKVEGEWIFYQKFRLSSLIQKMPDGWKVLHQHGSYPDSKTQEGEAFAFDTIKNENLRLKEAIKNRTKELEESNRELAIEASLERVRAVALSMNKPDDMLDVCQAISHGLESLGVKDIRNVQTAIFYEGRGTYMNFEYYDRHHKTIITETVYTNHEVARAFAEKMQKGKGEVFITSINGKEVQDWLAYQKTTNVFIDSFLEQATSLNYYWHSLGPVALGISTYQPLANDALHLFQRFLHVFELAYTRYLDIEQALTQARAAQIELAVEKVRAKALAMHNSTQILDVVATLRNEMLGLEIPGVVAATIYLKQEEDGYIRMWDLSSVKEMEDGFHVALDVKFKLDETDPGFYVRRVWNNQQNYFIEKQEAHDMAITIEWLRQYYPAQAEEVQQFVDTTPWQYLLHPTIQLANGKMSVDIMDTSPPPEMESILQKMGAAFDLAYKRFLDLQKSETQIREAQIELALERVRARTMAMQKSDELAEASFLLDSQVRALGIKTRGCAFNIYGDNESTEWFSSEMGTMPAYKTPRENLFLRYYEAGQKGIPMYVEEFAGDACAAHYEYLCTLPVMGEALKELKAAGGSFPTQQTDHVIYFKYGYLLFITLDPVPEAHDVFKRFAKVFEQTYTRFLDLQKAEAQARENQVQLGLERARTQSMIMQHSAELDDTLRVFHEQVLLLGIRSAFSFLWLPDEKNERHIFWAAWGEEKEGTTVFKSKAIDYPLDRNEPATAQCLIDWKGNDPIVSYHVPPPGVKNYFAAWQELIDGVEQLKPEYFSGGLYYVEAFMKYGCFGVIVVSDLTEDEKKILGRFAMEFEQTYTRFLDLQKAEAQAREAQVEAALERVRSRTLAMQKSEELAETSAVLFRQLILLGIEPNRLYITIILNQRADAEFWITDEDGSKVSAAYTSNMHDNRSFEKMFVGWKEKKQSLIIDMKGEELNEYFGHLTLLNVPFKNGLTQKRRIQHIAYFNQGFIGMASPDDQPAETIRLLERFAAVFNLTYTRFNDLKLAEALAIQADEDLIKLQTEKKRAEDALAELQQTQKQLIQSEKMASLGELTAGIAHEIQNPLNFVNNFSEVSNELIDEMNDELAIGNLPLAKEIAQDIKQNLEKINTHGKRADAIVKGMLQHSRSSSGAKEPTDINALCDEYLRLSYHGLRAKDKTFNATLKTDFDDSIGNIYITPQDIGRVVLNLINNAFYAVDEKKKSSSAEAAEDKYKPTVSVATKRINGKVEITVSDNGNGIPQKVVDKIFQPFFTTKPTGQGTGLGLSLSYDIIKAHGGEISVETKEDEGSRFIIQLPVHNK